MALNTKHIPVVAIFQDEMWGAYTLPKTDIPEQTNTSFNDLAIECAESGFDVIIGFGLDDEDEVDYDRIEKILCTKSFEDIYLDYINNYLSTIIMAERYGISKDAMSMLIDAGEKEHVIRHVKLKKFRYESLSSHAIGRIKQSYELINHLPNSEQESIKELGNKIIEILENSKPQ